MRPASPKMNNERHWVDNPPHNRERGFSTYPTWLSMGKLTNF